MQLECSETLLDSPETKALQLDDAAALLLMLGEESKESKVPPTLTLPAAYASESKDRQGIGLSTLDSNDEATQPTPAHSKRTTSKVDRVLRCGSCDGCRRADCGQCPNCRDKPTFGGAGVKKQACQHRRCLRPMRTGGSRAQWGSKQQQVQEADSDDQSQDSTVQFSPNIHGKSRYFMGKSTFSWMMDYCKAEHVVDKAVEVRAKASPVAAGEDLTVPKGKETGSISEGSSAGLTSPLSERDSPKKARMVRKMASTLQTASVA